MSLYYPCLKKYKYIEKNLNTDLSILSDIVKTDPHMFCSDPKIDLLKCELGLLIGLRNMAAHGNDLQVKDGIECCLIVKNLMRKLRLETCCGLVEQVKKFRMALFDIWIKDSIFKDSWHKKNENANKDITIKSLQGEVKKVPTKDESYKSECLQKMR